MSNELDQTIAELKELAGDEYGGVAQLAKEIGFPRQRLHDWLTGRRKPNVEAWLKIQHYLKKKRRRRKQTQEGN